MHSTNADRAQGCDVHPPAKQDCAKRLADSAMALVYKRNVAWRSPTFNSQMASPTSGGAVKITLNDVSDAGLHETYPFNYQHTRGASGTGPVVRNFDCTVHDVAGPGTCAWAAVKLATGQWVNATVTIAPPSGGASSSPQLTFTPDMPAAARASVGASVASAYAWGSVPMMSLYDKHTALPVLGWNESVGPTKYAPAPAAPPPSAPRLPQTVPSNIGLNTFFFNEGPYASEEEMRLLAASGATYMRNEIVWYEVEGAEGVYDWRLMDDLVAALTKHRLKGMFLFGPNPPKNLTMYGLNGSAPHSAPQRQAFARWAGAAMQRFMGQGHLWEILNEPLSFWRCPTGVPPDRWCACTGEAAPPGCPSCGAGWTTPWCEELFDDRASLHVAVTAAAPPGEYLIGGGVSQAVFDCDRNQTFLKHMLATQPSLLERWDAVSVHAYRSPACTTDGSMDPETVLSPYNRTWATIRQYTPPHRTRPPVQLVQSEWGYASNHYDPTHGEVGPLFSTPAMQAVYLARAYLSSMLAGVAVNFWYAWKDCTIVPAVSPPPPPGTLPGAAVGISTAFCNYLSTYYKPNT
jgi:hypothetical protein